MPVQGTIYIYTMSGESVKKAKRLKAKIGVVTGLTLDPVKQVFKCTGFIEIRDHVYDVF